ncbi:PilX N-terminal domain-containing pilus assembly protein [Clostridium sp.]|uniref:PilX N-terminal domain-containing pilus assembly protein n=1 Tax=Clostridium sp. TaxID=1506 RepID=UPI001A597E53|nr:PilX N-terminal domain-containing pilus assembly protein [Clostridium sp.]MBK5240153.1 hypothetical protein [Clostridium sp.]
MIPKNNKGSALIVVIMVMVVMTILGMAMLNISLSETRQASNEDKRLQAHYLARSGAEATLSAFENPDIVIKPIGTCEPVFLNNSNQFVNAQPVNMNGKFVVEIKKVGSVTTIISVGTVGNVQQTVIVTRVKGTTTVTDPPGDTVSGADLLWYDPSSGQASDDANVLSGKGKIVTVDFDKPNKRLKIEKKTPTYEADTIVFTTDIWNFKSPLTLNAGMLIFDVKLVMNRNGKNDGKLVLKVLPSVGVIRTDKIDTTEKWGRIQYDSQWYYYKNGSEIKSHDEFKTLDKIPIGDINFPGSSTHEIIFYTDTWS